MQRLALAGSLLAFVAGFADASTFVGASRVFCAHVTGNLVVLAADFALRARSDEWLKLATFPVFVLAVAAVTVARRRMTAEPPTIARRLLLANSVTLAVAALVPVRAVVVGLAVWAMGVQNAVHRVHPSLGPMTTVMTGNITQWVSEALGVRTPEATARHHHQGAVLLAFVLGCAAGAMGVSRFGFPVLVLPAAVTLVAATRLA